MMKATTTTTITYESTPPPAVVIIVVLDMGSNKTELTSEKSATYGNRTSKKPILMMIMTTMDDTVPAFATTLPLWCCSL